MSDWNGQSIRALERGSIDGFMKRHASLLKGRVLDFGAGKPGTCVEPEPYRSLVDGEYVPLDKGDQLPTVFMFDAIICTQVIQYLDDPMGTLLHFQAWLKPGGYLVMTYPTCWDEVEPDDLWRFTRAGMETMLKFTGFQLLVHEQRARIPHGGFNFPLGYGVVAAK